VRIGDGAGLAFTDFVIHDDGFARFLLQDKDMTARSAGRMLQRLFIGAAVPVLALVGLLVLRRARRHMGQDPDASTA
jgi:uncharacterized membrane-anchored protein